MANKKRLIVGSVVVGLATITTTVAVVTLNEESRSVFCTHLCTDLLTEPVAPGATIKTSVNMPLGAVLDHVGNAAILAGPGFIVLGVRFDGTHLEVEVRNVSIAAARFVGFVAYHLAPLKAMSKVAPEKR